MAEEQKISITPKGQYKNIDLKDIDNGNFIIVEKVFAEGMRFDKGSGKDAYSFYVVKVKYLDEEVGFLLYEEPHQEFARAGGIGDRVKITCELREKKKKGEYYKAFKFDLVE